jgi:IS5 family transposase
VFGPRRDEALMFKGLVIQRLYGLSDEQLEYQVGERRSFHRLMGLDRYRRSPDAKTFRAFRERLVKRGVMEALFGQLQGLGCRARTGQRVDAALAPAQRNTREEKAQLKAREVPEDRERAAAGPKRRRKDVAARWTKQHGTSHDGHKHHVNVDHAHKPVRRYAVNPANVHDSQLLDDLLDEDNGSTALRADSACRSGEQEQRLREKNCRSHVRHKGNRHQPLTMREQQGNRTRAMVRVAYVFGAQCATRARLIRCTGLKHSALAIGMVNLMYNMRRLCYLQGVSAPA